MQRTGQRGFTMLEMLLVVLIVLLMSAIAGPSAFQAIRDYQFEAVAREARNIVLRARYLAAQRNQRDTVIYQAPARY